MGVFSLVARSSTTAVRVGWVRSIPELFFAEAFDGLGDGLGLSGKEPGLVFVRSLKALHELRECIVMLWGELHEFG